MNWLRILLAIALAFLPLADASAAVVQITVKDAGGTTRNVNVTTNTDITGNLSWNNVICDQSAGTTCASVGTAGSPSTNALTVQPVTIGNGTSANAARVTLSNDSTGVVALAAGAATIGSLAANQSVSIASGQAVDGSIATLGTKADAATCATTNTAIACLRQIDLDVQAGVGATGASVPTASIYPGLNVGGTLRGVTGVNPSGVVYAMQHDVTSIAGTTAGTAASGVLKVGVVGNAAAAFDAAQSAAPPANALSLGMNASGATGGQQQRVIGCDNSTYYDGTTNGYADFTTVVGNVSGRKVYICGFVIETGGTATNVFLQAGTGAACVTTQTTQLTPAFQLAANDKVGANSPFWNGMVNANTGDRICIHTSAGNAVQAQIWYAVL